jgi:hypothetical protein
MEVSGQLHTPAAKNISTPPINTFFQFLNSQTVQNIETSRAHPMKFWELQPTAYLKCPITFRNLVKERSKLIH